MEKIIFLYFKKNFKNLLKKNEFLEHAKVFDKLLWFFKKIVIEKLKNPKKYYF